jgi:TRAP-type C4-dicarboxylate transport system permease small subunit
MADTPAPPPQPQDSGAARIARVLALAGGVLLVGLAALVTASVVMRWAGGEGVNGDFELVQTGLALAVFAFLPLCQAHRGNVMVDTFTTRLPARVQGAIDAVWDLVYAGFAAFIAWRLSVGAAEALSSQTTSMVLGIPQGYAIAACAVMGAFLTVVAVVTGQRAAKGKR